MQSNQARGRFQKNDKQIVVIVIGNTDRRCNPERFYKIGNGIAMADDESIAGRALQLGYERQLILGRDHVRCDPKGFCERRGSLLSAFELGGVDGGNPSILENGGQGLSPGASGFRDVHIVTAGGRFFGVANKEYRRRLLRRCRRNKQEGEEQESDQMFHGCDRA